MKRQEVSGTRNKRCLQIGEKAHTFWWVCTTTLLRTQGYIGLLNTPATYKTCASGAEATQPDGWDLVNPIYDEQIQGEPRLAIYAMCGQQGNA